MNESAKKEASSFEKVGCLVLLGLLTSLGILAEPFLWAHEKVGLIK